MFVCLEVRRNVGVEHCRIRPMRRLERDKLVPHDSACTSSGSWIAFPTATLSQYKVDMQADHLPRRLLMPETHLAETV
jgi:hypothetical protein